MDSLDLNINHYSFEDLMNLFKIETYDSTIDYKIQLNRKVKTIQKKYPEEIASFYYKTMNLLLVMFSLIDNKMIQKDEIEKYANRVKQLKDLEKKNENQLLNELLNINDLSFQNNYDNTYDNILNEPNLLQTNHLNKPNMNTHEGRVNPQLNNKNNTNVIYNTFPNEVTPGSLNSVKRITQLLNLNLNSCFRSKYYQSNPCDFLYLFPIEIKNVLSMRLASIEIPNAWYLFSSSQKNNFFEIELTVNGEKINYLITIPDGNYNANTLSIYLNDTYFYNSKTLSALKYINFSIDPYTLKSCFEILKQYNNGLNIQFTLKFIENINQNSMNTMGWILGFRLGSYLNIEDYVYSEGLFDAGCDRYIYVCVNDFQYNNNNSHVVCFDQSILNEDVIAKIPMINGKLSLVADENNLVLTKVRKYNGPINLSRLQIKILDKFGNLVDLNHMDFSFTLELEILYESFNFKNVTS
jgi:hypothetical protein